MKLLVVSSPTGGHFYPAVEIAKKLVSDFEKIVFVIQKNIKFIEIIKKEISCDNIVIEEIETAKFLRKNPLFLIKFFIFFTLSIFRSIIIFLKHKPNIIFSTGGYTSLPVVVSSKFINFNIP
ncbi:MAG: glycosyltransferase, partial [Endomicrobiia bacterium]